MILLFNVYITDSSATGGAWERSGTVYNRGNLANFNKLDVLKYSLASYAVAYPWSKAIINVELDTPYNSEKNFFELEKFVKEEFNNTNLLFSFRRNIHQEDWKKTYELLDDDLIMYQGNHDHIFIDSSIDYLHELTQLRDLYGADLLIPFSHYPEHTRMAKCGYIDISRNESEPNNPWIGYEAKENHIFIIRENYESLSIITKEIYHEWFCEGDWNSIKIPPNLFKSNKLELGRTEGAGVIGLGGIKEVLGIPKIKHKHAIPYKELFRHFDAYGHQFITNETCPALEIPKGFFEKNMKIRYGYDDYKEGWVNINPKNNNYYAHDISGTDYKFTLFDLPLAWKGRISEIDMNKDINEEEMVQYRLKSVLEVLFNHPLYDPYIDEDVQNKVVEYYLKEFPQYKLL